jgi:hypothetical protein
VEAWTNSAKFAGGFLEAETKTQEMIIPPHRVLSNKWLGEQRFIIDNICIHTVFFPGFRFG